MEMIPGRHDTDEKVLHNDTVLPALPQNPTAQQADEDIVSALDNLFEHQNTGPFIVRLLIQRMVKSNPTSRFIDDVAAAFDDNGSGERGDLKAVVKAMLLNKEAMDSYSYTVKRRPWRLVVEGGGTEHSRLQEPVVLNQEVYKAPHVFNFYLPDHVPGGELQDYRPKGRIPNRTVYAPEFEILTAVATNRIANLFRSNVRSQNNSLLEEYGTPHAIGFSVHQCYGCTDPDEALDNCAAEPTAPCLNRNVPFYVLFDLADEIADAPNPDLLIENLNILLCHGSLSDTTKVNLAGILAFRAPNTLSNTHMIYRAKGAIMSLLTAPDCAVHE
jgi:hypothetical protein